MNIAPLLLALLLPACSVYHPIQLQSSSRPLPAEYRSSGRVQAEACDKTEDVLDHLYREALGGHSALIEIRIDAQQVWTPFGTKSCFTLTATAVDFGAAAGPGRAPEPTGPPRGTASAPAGDRLPSSAYRAADLVYEALGRQRPEEEAIWRGDVELVFGLAERGLDVSTIIKAAQAGAETLGAAATLTALVKAGLPTVQATDQEESFDFQDDDW
jgi:hypothetical protein